VASDGGGHGRPRPGTSPGWSVSRTAGSGDGRRPHRRAPNSSSLLPGSASPSLLAPAPIPRPSTRSLPASAMVSPKLSPNSILPGTSNGTVGTRQDQEAL